MPFICHLLTSLGPPEAAEWQSGALSDKLSFVLCFQCGWPMLPLLAFAMFCLAQVLLDEKQAAKSWVRFGVFTGMPITAWYIFVFGRASAVGFFWLLVGGLTTVAVAYGLWCGLSKLRQKIPEQRQATTVFVIVIVLILLSFLAGVGGPIGLLLLPVFLSFALATPLAFLAYLGMSIRIVRMYGSDLRFSMAELLAGMTWLGLLFAAIRQSIELSFAQYSQLPLEPPEGCYVATAAAQGYPAIVGSHQLLAVDKQPVFVNRQLTTFKIAELTLRAISPVAHRVFRFVYNCLGPRLAALLSFPLAATLAYLSLKPAEWVCRLTLRILLGRKLLQQASNLYFDRVKAAANQ